MEAVGCTDFVNQCFTGLIYSLVMKREAEVPVGKTQHRKAVDEGNITIRGGSMWKENDNLTIRNHVQQGKVSKHAMRRREFPEEK